MTNEPKSVAIFTVFNSGKLEVLPVLAESTEHAQQAVEEHYESSSQDILIQIGVQEHELRSVLAQLEQLKLDAAAKS